jgi:outer membrane protein OmpA-like peptidoglycan-associated protein
VRHRLNPWPAVADLFSGLVVACFAALVLITATHTNVLESLRRLAKPEVHAESDQMLKALTAVFMRLPNAEIRECGIDRCIDVPVPFEVNDWRIAESYRSNISDVCENYKKALASFPLGCDREIQLIVEGHTDSQQPNEKRVTDPKERYLFNWELSSKRAGSILYELKADCGVTKEQFNIMAAGYADTNPKCKPADDPHCYGPNRRTTLRFHPDAEIIEGRLQHGERCVVVPVPK